MRVSDLELRFLEDQLSLIDAQINIIADSAKNVSDPDSFGHLDDLESLTGLGFVACQRYQTAVCGWMHLTKDAALSVGPRHNSGLTVARIVNHSANYWKHQDEWTQENATAQQQRTRAAVSLVSGGASDYPLSLVLTEIGAGYTFQPLIPRFTEWQEQLHATNDA